MKKKLFLITIMLLLGSCERYDMYDYAKNWGKLRIVTGNYSAGGFIYISYDGGETWVQRGEPHIWSAFASSKDGTRLVAGTQDTTKGSIYTSDNNGTTWTKQDTTIAGGCWSSIASSSDGSKLTAVDYLNGSFPGSGYMYTSNDSGKTWVQDTTLGTLYWNQVSSTPDGSIQAAVSGGASLTHIFINTGGGWGSSGVMSSNQYTTVAISYDGQKIAVGAQNSYIFTSTDAGATWTQRMTAGGASAYSIASSSDGMKIVVSDHQNYTGGYIYTSSDGGATWTQQTAAGMRTWRGLALSPDGMNIAAGVNGGYIYTSDDGGVTWKERTGAGVITCISIAMTKN